MIIINAEEGKKIHLGRVGENEARAVRFDISRIQAEFPGATFSVLNMRPQDPDAYPVNGQYIALDGSYLLWTIQSGDLAEDGLGECELKATLEGVIVKSIIWTTEICPALDGNGTPPEPWESWQQEVEENAQRAEDAAEDSEAWAVGERGGVPVEEDDPTYHNNAEYWAGQAQEALASKANKRDTVLETTLSRGRNAVSSVGTGSFAFGSNVKATGEYTHAIGMSTTASGKGSHAEGTNTTSSGQFSHAEGNGATASGKHAHAEGYDTSAEVENSHAEGTGTHAQGKSAHTEGNGTTAAGENAHAEGLGTRANRKNQHVFGKYNANDPSDVSPTYEGTFVEIVGNGTSSSNRTNARTLDWSGNERLKGKLYVEANADGTGGSEVAKITDIPEPVDISGKADKVSGGTADNLAALDASGNLKDSGKAASDFVAAEEFRADAMPMSASDSTTVAQTATELKSQIDGKADLIHDTVQNVAIASVPDGAKNLPLTALKIAVEPVQDLHGQANPYPAGGSKNKLPLMTEYTLSDNGISCKVSKGVITLSGTASAQARFVLDLDSTVDLSPSANKIAFCNSFSNSNCTLYFARGNTNVHYWGMTPASRVVSGWTDTGNETVNKIIVVVDSGAQVSGTISPMLVSLSETDLTFTPYSNICPITGWTGCNVYQSDADTSNPTTIPISWQTEAGTVYGCTLDPVNGVLTVDRASTTVDSNALLNNGSVNDVYKVFYQVVGRAFTKNVKSNIFIQSSQKPNYMTVRTNSNGIEFTVQNSLIGVAKLANDNTVKLPAAKTWFTNNPVQLVYELETPVTIQLDPVEIKTLIGTNNLWADCGNILLMEYGCDTKGYVEKRLSASQSLMELIVTANRESEMKASKAYTSGNLLIVNGTLYKATTSIANGATLTVGTNVTQTTVAAEIAALA